ncbi:MAG TPA: hypothetical protein EYG21_05735 [Nitrospinaceae bacterium]|nr:hypothetical protein [Nitrospinaceae bacterium]
MSTDIPQPKYYKILVIGESCKDTYRFGSADRLSPEAPVPVIKLSRTEQYPGMAANVANNLSSLDHKVCLFTNEESIEKTRIVDSRFNHHLLRIDEEPRLNTVNWDHYIGDALELFDAFVISDYDKGFLPIEFLSQTMSMLQSYNKPVFVDSKKKDLSHFNDCIIKINKKECETALAFPSDCELIITLGADGASWRGKLFPGEKTDVFDVCGAGDTFLAGLIDHYLQSSGDIDASINFANKCGALAVNKFGTFCVDRSLIE